ncbi:hypothetical protein C8R43DRAFT_1004606 [Mycena crocata]|nr:hypothetical protein C8R43DRAFT_1004606 [Mycena crocata]
MKKQRDNKALQSIQNAAGSGDVVTRLRSERDSLATQLNQAMQIIQQKDDRMIEALHAQSAIARDRDSLATQLSHAMETIKQTADVARERDTLATQYTQAMQLILQKDEELTTRLSAEADLAREKESLATQLSQIVQQKEEQNRSETEIAQEQTLPANVTPKREPEVTSVKPEQSSRVNGESNMHPAFSIPSTCYTAAVSTRRKRLRSEQDSKVKFEEPRAKIRKVEWPTGQKVEVVITRAPRLRVPSKIPSARPSVIPLEQDKNIVDSPRAARPIPRLVAHYETLFELALKRTLLTSGHVHLFDFEGLPRKAVTGRPRTSLVTHYRHIFDFATLPPRRISRIPRMTPDGNNAPLLDAPIFKQCLWSTEFFQNSHTLDALLDDESLTEYLPFIQKLHELNQEGIPQPHGIRKDQDFFRHTIFFEEDPDLRTVNVNTSGFLYSWGCVLRFLLLDMLLRCKGYKRGSVAGGDGSAIPQSVRPITAKLYKWEKYVTDIIVNSQGRAINEVPHGTPFQADGTETNGEQAYKNLLLVTLSIMSILEEPFLPSVKAPTKTFELSSLYSFSKFPLSVREQLPSSLSTSTVYRHLGVFLFVSPLSSLLDQDLEVPSVGTQILFKVARALGTACPTLIHSGEVYVCAIVHNLMGNPALGVPRAILHTQNSPSYVPPPYSERFFNAGGPSMIRFN